MKFSPWISIHKISIKKQSWIHKTWTSNLSILKNLLEQPLQPWILILCIFFHQTLCHFCWLHIIRTSDWSSWNYIFLCWHVSHLVVRLLMWLSSDWCDILPYHCKWVHYQINNNKFLSEYLYIWLTTFINMLEV